MADPLWSYQYDVNLTPEQNDLTRVLRDSPSVVPVTEGTPANRSIQIDGTNGDVVFITNKVPNLELNFGATVEVTLFLSAAGNPNGDFGVQVGFADRVILLDVFPDRVMIEQGDEFPTTIQTAPNNSDVVWRILVAPGGIATVYRNRLLIAGPIQLPVVFSRQPATFMFWCEGGAIGTIKSVKYFIGGAVA